MSTKKITVSFDTVVVKNNAKNILVKIAKIPNIFGIYFNVESKEDND